MNDISYTPESIVRENLHFSIPLYQRLFEWDVENIEVLLNDFCRSYSKKEDYYIGMLTSMEGGDLIDGQQRFTVLMLLGCILRKYYRQWDHFLKAGDTVRLSFVSRPDDENYLKQVISKEKYDFQEGPINFKMQQALKTIDYYLNDDKKVNDRVGFSAYIFEHVRFFISTLPKQYSPRALNKYFERMNSTGKNLEQHEILKVKLLSNLEINSSLMKLWNRISEVDTELLRIHSNETEDQFLKRRTAFLNSEFEDVIQFVNGIFPPDDGDLEQESSGTSKKTIGSIKPSNIPPKKISNIRNNGSLLSFPIILLLTLYWMLIDDGKEKEIKSLEEFFDPAHLLGTFSKHLSYEGAEVDKGRICNFIHRLLKARIILDYCFIRSSEDGYSLEMISEKKNDEDEKTLLMFESMLFVSSSTATYYKWFYTLMKFISPKTQKTQFPSARELYDELKKNDDSDDSHKLPLLEDLTYTQVNRYWFWRLDFNIWQRRKELFHDKEEALRVADNYRFSRNRSIEHVAPQQPVLNSDLQWDGSEKDQKIRDSFGNLVMISGGLNSSLQNRPFEEKKARVDAYKKGQLIGSIESLSLLLIFTTFKSWGKEEISKYGKKAYEILENSFNQPESISNK